MCTCVQVLPLMRPLDPLKLQLQALCEEAPGRGSLGTIQRNGCSRGGTRNRCAISPPAMECIFDVLSQQKAAASPVPFISEE